MAATGGTHPVLVTDAGAATRRTPPPWNALNRLAARHPRADLWYAGGLTTWPDLHRFWHAGWGAVVARAYLTAPRGLPDTDGYHHRTPPHGGATVTQPSPTAEPNNEPWWISNYRGTDYMERYGSHDIDFLVRHLELEPPHTILGLCCAFARHTRELTRRGYTGTTGVDLSTDPLGHAADAACADGEELRLLHATDEGLSGSRSRGDDVRPDGEGAQP